MGIRLSEEEAWSFLAGARTAILTTLRADGWPVSLPVWFVALDHFVYVRTPEQAKKVARVRADPRACLCVETGHRWTELKAVVVTGHAELVDDDDELARVVPAIDAKYRGLGLPLERLPERTRAHYSAASAVLRFTPNGRWLTWDNAKLRPRPGDR